MNVIDWFKSEFIPNCEDETIAQLVFLYERYSSDNKNRTPHELAFIKEKTEEYKNTEVTK